MNRRLFQIFIVFFLILNSFKCIAQNPSLAFATIDGNPFVQSGKHCYVLSIGIQEYDNFDNLNYPEQNCKDFIKAVKEQFRFQYEIEDYYGVANVNLDDISQLLKNLKKVKIKRGDIVCMYFSGHGKTIDNNYYYVVKKSRKDDTASMFSGKRIVDVALHLANNGALVLIFLDTCESGSIVPEKIDINDKNGGCIALFPASSMNISIKEFAKKGGSNYGNTLFQILKGDTIVTNKLIDSLSVKVLSDLLNPVIIEEQSHLYSQSFDIFGKSFINNIRAHKRHNEIFELYRYAILEGRSHLDKNEFIDAINHFGNAQDYARKYSFYNDSIEYNYNDELKNLKNKIKSIINEGYTKNNENAWRSLYDLDKKGRMIELTYKERLQLYNGIINCYNGIDRIFKEYSKKIKDVPQKTCDTGTDSCHIVKRDTTDTIPHTNRYRFYIGLSGGCPDISVFGGWNIRKFTLFSTDFFAKIEAGASSYINPASDNVFLNAEGMSKLGYKYNSEKSIRPFVRMGVETNYKIHTFSFVVGTSYINIEGKTLSGYNDERGKKAFSYILSPEIRYAVTPSPQKSPRLQIFLSGGFDIAYGYDNNFKVIKNDIGSLAEGFRGKLGVILNLGKSINTKKSGKRNI